MASLPSSDHPGRKRKWRGDGERVGDGAGEGERKDAGRRRTTSGRGAAGQDGGSLSTTGGGSQRQTRSSQRTVRANAQPPTSTHDETSGKGEHNVLASSSRGAAIIDRAHSSDDPLAPIPREEWPADAQSIDSGHHDDFSAVDQPNSGKARNDSKLAMQGIASVEGCSSRDMDRAVEMMAKSWGLPPVGVSVEEFSRLSKKDQEAMWAR